MWLVSWGRREKGNYNIQIVVLNCFTFLSQGPDRHRMLLSLSLSLPLISPHVPLLFCYSCSFGVKTRKKRTERNFVLGTKRNQWEDVQRSRRSPRTIPMESPRHPNQNPNLNTNPTRTPLKPKHPPPKWNKLLLLTKTTTTLMSTKLLTTTKPTNDALSASCSRRYALKFHNLNTFPFLFQSFVLFIY